MNFRRFLNISLAALLLATMLRAGAVSAGAQTVPVPPPQGVAPSEEVPRITLDDFKAMRAANTPVTVIDVRYQISDKIKGAIHIPLDQIETRLDEIPRDRPIVTYCA